MLPHSCALNSGKLTKLAHPAGRKQLRGFTVYKGRDRLETEFWEGWNWGYQAIQPLSPVESPRRLLVSGTEVDSFRGIVRTVDLWLPWARAHMHANTQVQTDTGIHTRAHTQDRGLDL